MSKPIILDAGNMRLLDSVSKMVKVAHVIAAAPEVDTKTRTAAAKVVAGYLDLVANSLEQAEA